MLVCQTGARLIKISWTAPSTTVLQSQTALPSSLPAGSGVRPDCSPAILSKYCDIRYGARERNRIDFLSSEPSAPTLVFVHGGYWQSRTKETFAFCAAGPLSHGINVAFIGYTLAPEASLDQIVAEIRSAVDYLVQDLPELVGNPSHIVLSGWSAGGNLSCMTLDHPYVKAGLLISGLYDLEPRVNILLNLSPLLRATNTRVLSI